MKLKIELQLKEGTQKGCGRGTGARAQDQAAVEGREERSKPGAASRELVCQSETQKWSASVISAVRQRMLPTGE